MYIAFNYNEKGNFYVSERVIGRIVESIIRNQTKGVRFVEADITMPRGLQMYINATLLLENSKDKIVFNSEEIIKKIKDIITDLLTFSPYNISLAIKKP